MRTKHTVYSEERLEAHENIELFKRLFPFVRPYRTLLAITVLMVVVIASINLAIPYVTKIVVDRYIVPSVDVSKAGGIIHENEKNKYYLIELENESIKSIVQGHRELFKINGAEAFISYEDLKLLDKGEIEKLREKDLSGIVFASLILMMLITANFLFSFVQAMLMEYMGQRIMQDLRIELFAHIQKLSLEFFSRNPLGRLVTRVANDIQNMYEMVTSILTFTFKDIFLLAGIIILLLVMNWRLALACFAVIPLIILCTRYFGGRIRTIFREIRIKIAEINSRISETISGVKVIQLSNQEDNNYKNFMRLNHENYQASMKQIHLFALFAPLINLMSAVSLAVVIFYGGMGVISQDITMGTLVVFISYLKMFFRPIQDITEKYNIVQDALASAERIFLIFDKQPDEWEVPALKHGNGDARPLVLEKFEGLDFNNVSFSYNKEEQVLKNVSFRLSRGQSLAVVGPSGAGKTSLINLLLKFYRPDAGKVLINGKDISLYDITSVRKKTALVTQDPFLFSGTIKENILSGRGDITESEFELALELSRCNVFIDRLKDRELSTLGEGAANLSSGERQLLSIARAFAGSPEIIILDEATSYIDSEMEIHIQEALSNLMKNRTSIIIAHRLSTARRADNIIFLNNGEIAESGTHEELMAGAGLYYKLNIIQR